MSRLDSVTAPYDFDYVAQRLAQAGHTLMVLQVQGLRPAGFRSAMPQPTGTVADDRRAAPPTPNQISEMDQALSWVTIIPAESLTLRRLVQARSLTVFRHFRGRDEFVPLYSWKMLGRWMRVSDHTAKSWWIGGIDLIVLGLQRPCRCQDGRFEGSRNLAVGALEAAANKAGLAPTERIRELQRA